MKSNYFVDNNIAIFILDVEDIKKDDLGIELLKLIKKEYVQYVIFDLALFEVITTEDISFIKKLIEILKLNNIEAIVCNFNIHSAAIIFHFIDEITFKTELNVQKAIDVIKNIKKK